VNLFMKPSPRGGPPEGFTFTFRSEASHLNRESERESCADLNREVKTFVKPPVNAEG
jgi:hypothetical protein